MKFTILTEPVSVYYSFRTFVKKMIGRDNGFGGHPAVTRSLLNGLKDAPNVEFNYRPINQSQINSNVHVLGGINTLKYAIKLKKKGIIRHLSAGPNVVVFSTDANDIIADREVELYLQPCQWAVDLHIKMNENLNGRCKAWAAGVDLNQYDVSKRMASNKVIIYHKDESDQFCFRLQYLVKKYGYKPIVIKYGSYKFDEYINALSSAAFMVSLSRQESQGLFLAEAWAMDVPTICFDPHFYHWPYDYIDVTVSGDISTCPYLSEMTGVRFETIYEFENILSNWNSISVNMAPRRWIEENMTDEISARHFLELVEEIYE